MHRVREYTPRHMSLLQRLIGAALRPRVKSKARGKTLEQLADELAASRDYLMPRVMAARDTPGNREAINHWLGIERWSLDNALSWEHPNEPQSYRRFRLPEGASLAELQRAFAAAREETIAAARRLARADVNPAAVVVHKDLGPLSVTEWFQYIDDHSRREVVRLRR